MLKSRIAYIASGKTGLHSFTFRELELIENKQIDFTLCLTQLRKGIFIPKNNWKTLVFDKWKNPIDVIWLIVNQTKLFLKLFKEAYKSNAIKYLAVAIYFSRRLTHINSVHCQMGDHKLFIGYYVSQILNIQLTVTIHAHELYHPIAYIQDGLYHKALSYCSKIITISEYNKNYLVKNLKVPIEKIKIMRLYPAHTPTTHNKLFRFLVIGNWVVKKGYDFLFRTIREIERDDFIFWIIGGPTNSVDSIDLNALVKKYKIKEKVKILGYQTEEVVKVYLEACDIFCLTSITDYNLNETIREREGIPVALMEAIIYKKPVIATKHAGIPELVNNLLVSENNIGELKQAMLFLMNNENEWPNLTTKNYEILKTKFTENNVNILVNILSDLNL